MENKEKKSVNYAFKIVGYLGHDNKLFDRTCPACKGMYSSQITDVCPKCGQKLTYITNAEGKAMSISEGTIYPSFGPKQEARDAQAVTSRKNGMSPIYRFKLFSFIDEQGVLVPPQFHSSCLKGAKVEVLVMNHQLVPSWFQTKEKVVRVELMLPVYANYGDTFNVLTAAQYANKVVSHEVKPDGSPAELVDANQRIAELEHQLAEAKSKQGVSDQKLENQSPDWTNEEQLNAAATVVSNTILDPFAYANVQ